MTKPTSSPKPGRYYLPATDIDGYAIVVEIDEQALVELSQAAFANLAHTLQAGGLKVQEVAFSAFRATQKFPEVGENHGSKKEQQWEVEMMVKTAKFLRYLANPQNIRTFMATWRQAANSLRFLKTQAHTKSGFEHLSNLDSFLLEPWDRMVSEVEDAL